MARESHRKLSRQALCTIPVKQATCPVFQPAFQVYGFRRRQRERGLWSFEDNSSHETQLTADPAQHIGTRVESVINAFNINYDKSLSFERSIRSLVTDAMPLGKALRSKKIMRNQTTKGKSPEDPSQKKNQVAFAVSQQEGHPNQGQACGGSPERRVYPPTPYIDRRRLPPRKLKHETQEETSTLHIQGISPVSPASMFMEQPPSPCGKNQATTKEKEHHLSTSPKKETSSLPVRDLHIKEDIQQATPIVVGESLKKSPAAPATGVICKGRADTTEGVSPQKLQSQKESQKPATHPEQVRFINIAQSYSIENGTIGDVDQSKNENANSCPDTEKSTHDVNHSNNQFTDDVPQASPSKGIDAIVDQLLQEVEGQDLGKGDINDALQNLLKSNEDSEMYAQIAQRVINTLPSVSPKDREKNANCAVNVYHTQSESSMDDQQEGAHDMYVPDYKQAVTELAPASVQDPDESISSGTLVPESISSGPETLPCNMSDMSEEISYISQEFYSQMEQNESDTSTSEMSASTSMQKPIRKYLELLHMYPRLQEMPKEPIDFREMDMWSLPDFHRQNEDVHCDETARNNSSRGSESDSRDSGLKKPIKTELEFIYTENQDGPQKSAQWRSPRNPRTNLDYSPSKDSLDFGKAYGVVHKSPQKRSAEQREELRGFFRGARSPMTKNNIPHFAKTGHFLYHLYQHGKLADVHIRLRNKSFRAHSAVLAAHSEYLACLLLNEGTPIYHMQLRDCITPTALTILLEYMYTGELAISDETVVEVLSATLALQMHSERDSCRHYIDEIEPSKLLRIWLQALQHDLTEDAANLLKANAMNFLTVTTLKEFLMLPLDRVLELLSREDLYICTELDVARAGMRWVHFDSENRRRHIGSIMNTVRLQHMTLKEVHSLANEAPELMKSQSRSDLLNACWFLSSKQEQLPHQLGDIQIPANRVKILELRKEAAKNGLDDLSYEFLAESYSSPVWGFTSTSGYGDGAKKEMGSGTFEENVELHSKTTVFDEDEFKLFKVDQLKTYPGMKEDSTENMSSSVVSPTPEEEMFDLWINNQPPSHIKTPSIGDQCSTLRNYIVKKAASTLIMIGGYSPCHEHDSLTGLTMLCLTEDMSSFCLQGLLPEGRIHHTVEYLDNKIYIIGGMNPLDAAAGRESPVASVFSYDLKTAEWHQIAPLNIPRSHHGSCIIDNTIYVIGGQDTKLNILSSVERYDLKTHKWTEVKAMPEGRLGPCVVAVDGRIFVTGGCGPGDEGYVFNEVTVSYDPATDMWTEVSSKSNAIARCYASAAAHDGNIWVSGGVTPSRSIGHPLCCSLSLVEYFNLSTKSWTPTEENLTIPRHHSASAVINNCLLVIGGQSTMTNAATKIVETYDIEKNCWRDIMELPRPLMGGRAVVVPPVGMKT